MSKNPGATFHVLGDAEGTSPGHMDGRAARHLPDHVPTAARLVDTAARLFRANGYASTTTRQLSAELGINKASLYYHVGAKEDLLFRICVEAISRVTEDVKRAIESAPEEDRMLATIRTHVTSSLRDADLHAVMQLESARLSEARLTELNELRRVHQRLLREVARKDRQNGRLRKDVELKYLMLQLMATLNWAVATYDEHEPLSHEAFADRLAKLYLTGAKPPAEPSTP